MSPDQFVGFLYSVFAQQPTRQYPPFSPPLPGSPARLARLLHEFDGLIVKPVLASPANALVSKSMVADKSLRHLRDGMVDARFTPHQSNPCETEPLVITRHAPQLAACARGLSVP